uniref:Uncharacterized protein n=1 Tax=Vitis vinifera TaxID=29760 RepID=F6H2S1_VITVI
MQRVFQRKGKVLHKKLLEEGLEELSHVNSKKKKAIEREIKRRFRTNSRVSPKKKEMNQ